MLTEDITATPTTDLSFNEPETHMLYISSLCRYDGDIRVSKSFLRQLSDLLEESPTKVVTRIRATIRHGLAIEIKACGEYQAGVMASKASALALAHKCNPMVTFSAYKF
jgi:hypothetical protein